MKSLLLALAATALLTVSASAADENPLKVLLITGGCCHDYAYQSDELKKALAENGVAADVNVVMEGGTGTEAQIDLYNDPNWADGYDVVVHNECFANTDDPQYVRSITSAHKKGVNAVVIHCAMHTYRKATIDDWREFLGVTSRRHDHKSEYPVKVVAKDHPIMDGFPSDWSTPKDELYVIEKLWPNAKVLATSVSEKSNDLHPVFWTNQYGKARVFGTTYGHANETFADPVFRKALTKGILWAAGRLK